MIHKFFDVNIDYSAINVTPPENKPTLEIIIPVTDGLYPEEILKTRPTVLILPGGAYHKIAQDESDPIAIGFMNEGFNCAILRYSVAPTVFPASLCETAKAVKMLYDLSDEYKIDKDNIFLCGFSAGGHLAANYGVFWNQKFISDAIGSDSAKTKAKGTILGYPVLINHGKNNAHSFKCLLGDNYGNPELMKLTSLENQVTSSTLPAFIFHCLEDKSVDVEGTLLFAKALQDNNVPFDLHIYTHGPHGFGTGRLISDHNLRAGNWMQMASTWMLDLP